jgi:hypothetical protein
MMASTGGNDSQAFTAGDAAYALSQSAIANQEHAIDTTLEYNGASFLSAPSYEDAPEESLYFAMSQKLFPDFGFSWDVDFGSLKVLRSDASERSPEAGNGAKRPRQSRKDATSEDIPIRRSAWVPDPKTNSQAGSLVLRSDLVSSHSRDSLFAMVLANNPTPHRVPSFPSAELLNYMIETHFAVEDPKSEGFIHRSSLDPATTGLDLISAVVSNGATYISSPAIWHFGLALYELTAGMIQKVCLGYRSPKRLCLGIIEGE